MRYPHQRRPSKNRSRRLAAAKHTVRSGYFPPQPKANATPFPQVASLTCHVSIAYGYNVIINRSSFSLSQSFSIPSSSFCSAIFFYGACATNLFAYSQPLVFLSATRFAFPLVNPHLEPLSLLFFLSLPPLFPSAVQGSAFPVAFVSCGTKALPSAKTSTFIGLFGSLCIFIHRLFRSLLTVYHRSLPCRFVRFCSATDSSSCLNERI